MLYTIIISGALFSAALAAVMSVAALILSDRAHRLPHGTTPISVLKPVKGLDDELEANLESFCLQTHERYELIVGAADSNDPALDVARRVKQRFPHVAFRIVAGEWITGFNPKVRNLRNLLSKARYSALLVSDGDIRVNTDYLSVMAGALERPNVGLVSNLVVGRGEQTIGAACENLQLNGFVATSVAAAQLIARHPVVVGKSMLFRREALCRIGGFQSAADVLAEDYLLGRAVLKAGFRVSTLGYPVWAINRNWSVSKMLQRHTRWAQIRRHVSPGMFLLEPLAIPELWLMLVAIAGRLFPNQLGAVHTAAVLTTVALSVLIQRLVSIFMQRTIPQWTTLVLLPLSSLLAFYTWLRAWNLDIVVWRHQSYRISAGSRLTLVNQQQHSPTRRARMPEAA
jgi:ceramide glucosyltransferase